MNEQTRASIGQAQQGQEESSDTGGKPSPKGSARRGTKAKVELTQERLKELLHYDPTTGVLTRAKRTTNSIKIGDVAGCVRPDGYIQIMILGRYYRAHRLAWLYVHGKFPKGEIDHVNHITTDNRIGNLREGSTSDNMENLIRAHSDNKIGMLGVSWHKPKSAWHSRIHVKGKKRHLGYFKTPEEAHQAYLNAKRKLHEFNVL